MLYFRFDCGSGTGKVRSTELVVLNQWNTLTVYRYRWDAWILLNNGQRILGRSKVRPFDLLPKCNHCTVVKYRDDLIIIIGQRKWPPKRNRKSHSRTHDSIQDSD